jgi:hypothetical protein
MSKNKTQKSPHYFKDIIALLEELHKYYPAENLGWHIALATADYSDVSLITDRELLFAFQKYQAERELDVTNLVTDEYVRGIQNDAEHLFDKQTDDWEEEEDY